MTGYYAVKKADCTPEQIEQIYNLFMASMDDDSSGYHEYVPDHWHFIVFKETEEIHLCFKAHLNEVRAVLITPEEAILRLFGIYLEK